MGIKSILRDLSRSAYCFFNQEEIRIKDSIIGILSSYRDGLKEVELIRKVEEEAEILKNMNRQKMFSVLNKLKDEGSIEKVLVSGAECTQDWYWKIIKKKEVEDYVEN